MANYTEVSPETEELFREAIKEKELKEYIDFILISDGELKTVTAIKKDALTKYLTDADIMIIINDDIFDMLEDDQKKIVIDEFFAPISYNTKKESIEIGKTNLNTFMSIVSKYKYENYERLQETIKSAKEHLKIK